MNEVKSDFRTDLIEKKWKWVLGGFLILLTVVRVINIQGIHPEYDEIWTFSNYVKLPVFKILQDVATPNNHVLNTLWIKFSSALAGPSLTVLRSGSWLSYLLLGGVLIFAAGRFLKNRFLQCAFVFSILLDGLVLHYAEVARGYEMQCLWVTGLFFALLSASEGGPEVLTPKRKLLCNAAFLLCGIGACLSVSSGVIFVTLLTFLWKVLSFPRGASLKEILEKERYFLAAGVLFSIFVLCYYGGNYQAFAEGRSNFGEVFTAPGAFFLYSWNILKESNFVYPLILTGAGAFLLKGFPRKAAVMGCGSMILLLLSALVTKGGPVRIYMPLIGVLYFGAYVVLEAFLEKLPRYSKECSIILTVLLIGISFGYSDGRRLHFADPDLGGAFINLSKTIPKDILLVFRPTDAYVVISLYGQTARNDFAERLMNTPKGVLLIHDNLVTGMRFPDFGTNSLSVSGKAVKEAMAGDGLPCYYHPWRKIRKGEDLKGRIVFCLVSENIKELRTKDNFLKKNFMSINGFFNPVRGMAPSYLFAADGGNVSAEFLLKLEEARPEALAFRVLGE